MFGGTDGGIKERGEYRGTRQVTMPTLLFTHLSAPTYLLYFIYYKSQSSNYIKDLATKSLISCDDNAGPRGNELISYLC